MRDIDTSQEREKRPCLRIVQSIITHEDDVRASTMLQQGHAKDTNADPIWGYCMGKIDTRWVRETCEVADSGI